eukprot:contig_17678_g4338
MEGSQRGGGDLMLVERDGFRTVKLEAVVVTLEPGLGLLLATVDRQRSVAVGGNAGAVDWDDAVPLLRGRTRVDAVDVAGCVRGGITVTIPPVDGRGKEEVRRLRTGSTVVTDRWVERIAPWLVPWLALVRSQVVESASVAPGGHGTVVKASATAALASHEAWASASVALGGVSSVLRHAGAGVTALGHALNSNEEWVRAGESIPIAGPMVVCLAAVCRMCAAVEAERQGLVSVMADARRQAEVCVYALLLSTRRSDGNGVVARGLLHQLSALEDDVWKLLQFRVSCRRKRDGFGFFRGEVPSAVMTHLMKLGIELNTLLSLAALEPRHTAPHEVLPPLPPPAVLPSYPALEPYKNTAATGDVGAKRNLGHCYRQGLEVAKDEERAVGLYKEAAATGNAVAKSNLDHRYEQRFGAAKEEKRVVGLYEEAAATGDAVAKSSLGQCYEKGLGEAKDEKRAVQLYKEAAAAGDAGAKSNLGQCCRQGLGVAKDEKRAVG